LVKSLPGGKGITIPMILFFFVSTGYHKPSTPKAMIRSAKKHYIDLPTDLFEGKKTNEILKCTTDVKK